MTIVTDPDAIIDALDAGVALNLLTWEAINWHDHPELFEHAPDGPASAPWPIEPHNWPIIPADWWKTHALAGDDDQMPMAVAQFAEDLAASNCHPGMIVRHVHATFQATASDSCVDVLRDVIAAARAGRLSHSTT